MDMRSLNCNQWKITHKSHTQCNNHHLNSLILTTTNLKMTIKTLLFKIKGTLRKASCARFIFWQVSSLWKDMSTLHDFNLNAPFTWNHGNILWNSQRLHRNHLLHKRCLQKTNSFVHALSPHKGRFAYLFNVEHQSLIWSVSLVTSR